MSADPLEGSERARQRFTDDDIRRTDLPRDAFALIHDLAYDHAGRDRQQYRDRAQAILRVGTPAAPETAPDCGKNMGNDLLIIPCDLPKGHKEPCERNIWPVSK